MTTGALMATAFLRYSNDTHGHENAEADSCIEDAG